MMRTYNIFNPKLSKPCHLSERNDAIAAYDWYIASIPERIVELRKFVSQCGYTNLKGKDFIPVLNEFYFSVCSEIVDEASPGPLELSLASDINMYIGSTLIENIPNLHWAFHTHGKSDVNYQSPVIMGFSKAKNKNYSREFFHPIGSYAVRIIQGEPKESDLFIRLYNSCAALA